MKIVYFSIISALFIMALSSLLNNVSIPNGAFIVITISSLFLRLVITLFYELHLLITLLKSFYNIQFKRFKVTFCETKYIHNITKRFKIISLYRLNVIRC